MEPLKAMINYFNFIVFFSFFSTVFSKQKFDVEINEICTNNKNILKDAYGNYSDWIELFNSGNNKIDLSGYGLSDTNNNLFKFTFLENTIIEPGEFLILFCSKDNSTSNEIHTGFSLSNKGEIIILTSPEGELIEKIEIPPLEEDETYGKFYNNTFMKMIPTPGMKNKIWIDPPLFSQNSGFYENEFMLFLSTSEKDDADIYYTIDGSNPINSTTSKLYKDSILIYDRSGEPNIFGEYEENEDSPFSITRGVGYRKPNYLLDKSMVVRAVTQNKFGHSKIIEKTYFITTENLLKYKDLTVISLVTNPDNLFDAEKGIYVTGNQFIEWKNSDKYNPKKNVWDTDNKCNYFMRGSEWEREASVTIFEKGEILLEQNLGIRIKGSSTRNTPSKSFNLIARKKYGKSTIKCRIFENNYDKRGKIIEEYKSFSLRQVNSETRLRDKFTTDLFHHRNLTTAEMRISVLFLNGEYWGMYIIAEHFTNFFIESHYNIPKENLSMIKQYTIEEGPETEYNNFMDFAYEYANKDLTESGNYLEVFKKVDFISLMEHYASGIYIGIEDWPGYNFGVWRYMGSKIEGNDFSDGKWRLITYDLDKTLLNSSNDDWIHMHIRSNGTPAKLFISLLKNKHFKKKFVNIYCEYANGLMSMDKINKLIENYRENCTELIANSQHRWHYYDGAKLEGYAYYKQRYLNALDNIYNFFNERTNYTLQHMKKYLNLTGEICELTILKNGNGTIQVNSIIPEMYNGKWKGKYISDYPITITALASENSSFKGWSKDIVSNEEIITITLEKDIIIQANFENILL